MLDKQGGTGDKGYDQRIPWFQGRFYFFLSTGRCFGSYFNSLWAVIGGYCSVQKRFKVPDPVGSQVLRALA